MKPLVSCICPTYNRFPEMGFLLEESVECFLRQDYPEKELIIINDCPGQELVCKQPDVVVLNVPVRYSSMGTKRNAAILAAKGNLICMWDDDDISLPWRLSFSVEMLGSGTSFNPKCQYVRWGDRPKRFESAVCYTHNASIFTREAWERVGRYPDNNIDDVVMHDALLTIPGARKGPIDKGDCFYLYRIGKYNNLSTGGDCGKKYAEIGKMPIQAGRYEILPRWATDYTATCFPRPDPRTRGYR